MGISRNLPGFFFDFVSALVDPMLYAPGGMFGGLSGGLSSVFRSSTCILADRLCVGPRLMSVLRRRLRQSVYRGWSQTKDKGGAEGE
jgi:hypothetical protein